jgi:hypothetical protein
MDFERQHPDDRFILRSLGATLILVGNRPPSAAGMRWLERELVAFGAKHPGRAAYLHYAFDGGEMVMPDDETRAAMRSVAANGPKAFAGIAMIMDYEGFVGAAVRSVLSGVLLAARAPKHLKIFGTVAEGRGWIEAFVNPENAARRSDAQANAKAR